MSLVETQLTDHELSKFIRDNKLTLQEVSSYGATGSNYYQNDNVSIELLVLFDNTNNTRKIFIDNRLRSDQLVSTIQLIETNNTKRENDYEKCI